MKPNNSLFNIDPENTLANTQDENRMDLNEIFGILINSKWLILLVTTIAVIIGISKALLSTPIYKVDAMLQVEESTQSLAALGPLEGMAGTKMPVQTEMEIVQSRKILGATVKNLNLDIVANPLYFPVFGQSIARNFHPKHKDELSPPLFGYSKYAWGGELIKIESLQLPLSWEGRSFTLISGKKGFFELYDNNKQLIVKGEVGKTIEKTIEGENIKFRIFISLLNAWPDTVFLVSKKPLVTAISNLKHTLSVSERGKGTGIFNITLDSPSPTAAAQTLNNITRVYVNSNIEQKSEEAQKKLIFIKKQLPIIKSQLRASTTKLNAYRLQKGSVDLNFETQSVLQGVVESKTQITLLQQKKEELRRNFTPFHPAVLALERQIKRLAGLVIQSNKKINVLPETQQQILRLSEDVQVNASLYNTLLDSLQTIKVTKAGTVSDVRVIDYAMLPLSPIKPKKSLIVGISFVVGLVLGIALAFVRNVMNQGITNPNIIEKHLNIPIYASISHSETQKKLATQHKKSSNTTTPSFLLLENNEDPAIESLRSLRTTLHFAFLDAKNNILMITGPKPSIGKSFISTNLAFVLASSGKKVLLIDADLRKGRINRVLGVERENGLSELILNDSLNADAVKTITTAEGNIDFISTGEIPPNPSELLLHEHFGHLLDTFSQQYDQIIIDTPPILSVTDASIIGSIASVTLMVIRAGEHPMAELEQSVKRLKQNNVSIKGIIFNDVTINSSKYGYGDYIYQYNYS